MGSLSLCRQDLVLRMVSALHAILYHGACYILASLFPSSVFHYLTGPLYAGALYSPSITTCAMDRIWYCLCFGDPRVYLLCTCRLWNERSHIQLQRTTMAQELESCGFIKETIYACALSFFNSLSTPISQ